MRLAVPVLALACATPCFAEGSATIAVGVGNCQNTELMRAVQEFSRALEAQPKLSLIGLERAARRLGRHHARSVQEVQRQIVVVQDHFYRGQFGTMVEHLAVAFEEISRLAPGRARWQLFAAAWNLEALVRSRIKKRGTVEDAYRHILRLDPSYKLDPDYVAPSMIRLFEATRRELAAAPRTRLTVKSNPAGARVYLDGRALPGRTPLKVELPEGGYVLEVGEGDRLSLPRRVEVPRTTEVLVDLDFEGAVHVGRGLCLAAGPDELQRLKAATRLGSLLDAEQVVMLRLEKVPGQPTWLTATSVVGSARVREGGLEADEKVGISPEAMAALARFIATGERTAFIRPRPPAAPPAAAAPASALAPVAASAPAPGRTQAPAASPPAQPGAWRRPAGFAGLGLGGVALVTGGVLFAAAQGHEADFQSRFPVGVPPAQAAEGRELRAAIDSSRTLGFAALGAGAIAAGLGGWLLWSAPRDSPAAVALLPAPGGGWIGLAGTLPW